MMAGYTVLALLCSILLHVSKLDDVSSFVWSELEICTHINFRSKIAINHGLFYKSGILS